MLPLAALAEPRTYTFGNTLTKEYSPPEGMFIITEGQCKVCSEDVATRMNKLEGTPKNIIFSANIEDLGVSKKEENKETDVVAFPQYYTFAVLCKKDYFGSRMLYSNRQWEHQKAKHIGPQFFYSKIDTRASYLSVIADSAIVKVLLIKRGMLSYLSSTIKRNIINRIKQFQDEDRPGNMRGLEHQKADMQKWENYKEKIAIHILRTSTKKGFHP